MAGTFDVASFGRLRVASGIALGEPLTAVPETGSTNDDALEAAKRGEVHGATFVAESQTRGRGRRGHTWTSPPGENLTFSVLLRPRLPIERVSPLALVVGLAVREVAARRVDSRVTLKWPNDVLVGRKKLAGILVESRLGGALVEAVVAGVGINVAMRALPDDIAATATSLALLGDPDPRRESVLVEFFASFESRYGVFVAEGLAPLADELRDHDALFGSIVTVGDVRGIADGIDDDGALRVRTAGAAVERIIAGTVVWES